MRGYSSAVKGVICSRMRSGWDSAGSMVAMLIAVVGVSLCLVLSLFDMSGRGWRAEMGTSRRRRDKKHGGSSSSPISDLSVHAKIRQPERQARASVTAS